MENIEQDFFIFKRKLNWFIDGIGQHGIPWNLFEYITPEWIIQNYNVEISYFQLL